jgi:hypothetical protein
MLALQLPTDGHGKRTLGILAAADLDELLDIGDFGRHFGGCGGSRSVIWSFVSVRERQNVVEVEIRL